MTTKFSITIDEEYAPHQRDLREFYISGAVSWKSGKARDDNPYNSWGNITYRRTWYLGWDEAAKGIIKFEDIDQEGIDGWSH